MWLPAGRLLKRHATLVVVYAGDWVPGVKPVATREWRYWGTGRLLKRHATLVVAYAGDWIPGVKPRKGRLEFAACCFAWLWESYAYADKQRTL